MFLPMSGISVVLFNVGEIITNETIFEQQSSRVHIRKQERQAPLAKPALHADLGRGSVLCTWDEFYEAGKDVNVMAMLFTLDLIIFLAFYPHDVHKTGNNPNRKRKLYVASSFFVLFPVIKGLKC